MRGAKLPARLLSLDLETSGLDPRRDAIVSVGAVPLRHGTIVWRERLRTVVDDPRVRRPRDAAGEGALGAHQTLPSEQRGGLALDALLDLVARATAGDDGALLVHGASIERGFLDAAARATGRRGHRFRAVCTLAYLRAIDRYRPHLADRLPEGAARFAHLPTALAEARDFFGLPAYPAHDPLYDALGTAELYLLLAQRFPELHPGVTA